MSLGPTRRWLARALMAVASALPGAQVPAAADTPNASIMQYEGADRQQRLQEGARKEGELVLYTSLTVEDMAALNGAFERKH